MLFVQDNKQQKCRHVISILLLFGECVRRPSELHIVFPHDDRVGLNSQRKMFCVFFHILWMQQQTPFRDRELDCFQYCCAV